MNDTKELFRPLANLEAPDVWDRVGVPSQHHVSTPRHRKVFALLAAALITAVIVAVMVAAFAPADPSTPATTPSIPPDLSGQELIDYLGLPVIGGELDECRNRMGWDGVLYCLDPVADTDAEVTALSEQIWGHELHGQALIDALALPVIDQHDTDCKYIFDFEGPYYCLDSVADSKTEALALWNQVINAPSQEAALDAANATLAKAIDDLTRAVQGGDQAAIDEAIAAKNDAMRELARLLQGEAPVVDVNASVEEQIAALDRRSAETLLELEGARQDLEQARLGGETQEAEARVEMIENEIRIMEDAVADLCSELRPSGNSLPPAC